VADIRDLMPLILAAEDYVRWLGDQPDPHPHQLMRPFPASDAHVADLDAGQQPEDDDASILEPIEPATGMA
jgi:putative SOS response-associated peptidase YedK